MTRTNIDTLDTLNYIEDGLLAMKMIVNQNTNECVDEESFIRAYDFVNCAVLERLHTAQADLTAKVKIAK